MNNAEMANKYFVVLAWIYIHWSAWRLFLFFDHVEYELVSDFPAQFILICLYTVD